MSLHRWWLVVAVFVVGPSGCRSGTAAEPDRTAASTPPTTEPIAVADITIGDGVRAFELVTTTRLPERAPATSRHRGRWDERAGVGDAVLTIDSAGSRQEFAYRRTVDRFWVGIEDPSSKAIRWIGVDPATPGADAVGALLDGGRAAADLLDAVVWSGSSSTAADGSATLDVRFTGDVAGPLGASANLMERLQTAGFDGSVDAEVTGTLRIDASGQLSAVTADLAPWWLAAYRELDIPIDEIEITIELTLTALEGPLDIEAPCPTPVEECST